MTDSIHTHSIRERDVYRVSISSGSAVRDKTLIAIESPIEIDVIGVTTFQSVCTPKDPKALAVGMLFSEGLIESLSDIDRIEPVRSGKKSFQIQLTPQALSKVNESGYHNRDVCKMSSGSLTKQTWLDPLRQVSDRFAASPTWFETATKHMQERQAIFSKTGGTHAAVIVKANGHITAFAEDIGRHNAFDKAIGKCLIRHVSPAGQGIMLSGRVSLEMLTKAVRAGIELIGAVSAPSSLAIEAAEKSNITLCGFVRNDHATIYTHPHRVLLK